MPLYHALSRVISGDLSSTYLSLDRTLKNKSSLKIYEAGAPECGAVRKAQFLHVVSAECTPRSLIAIACAATRKNHIPISDYQRGYFLISDGNVGNSITLHKHAPKHSAIAFPSQA